MTRYVTWFMALTLLGCAPTLTPDGDDAGVVDSGPWTGGDIPPSSGSFTHSVAEGVVTTVVDATSATDWQHLDMDSGHSVEPSEGWELAFSRFRVRINGGTTGSGGVQVAALDGVAWDDVTRAPEEGWTVPGPDGEVDDDTEPDNVFNDGERDWYDYDVETHTLTPRDVTYVVASTEGAFFKLRFEAYYDDAGSPAVVRFRWAPVAAPASMLPDAGMGGPVDGGVDPDSGTEPLPDHAITVNAGDGAAWVYVSATEGVVTPADPEHDPSWDIAFRRTEVRTNSGTSGVGLAGARIDGSGLAFDALTDASTFGFVVDEVVDTGRPGTEPTSLSPLLTDWYDYDPSTHSVTPSDLTFVVRTGVGGYAKLRIWRWDDGTYQLSLVPIERRVERLELDVDATSSDAWTYLSLRDGALVTVMDPSAETHWDLGISRTRFRTNSGTSGGGMGAAVETPVDTIAALGDAPTEGWTPDETITPARPGAEPYSANPVLEGWYDYDPATHVVSPRPVVFAVRTADGHVGALRILSYASGTYRVAIAFAGPGRTSF